jgi:perosamine synthetase
MVIILSTKKIRYADPYITEEDVEAVAEAVRNKRLSQGEYAARFEQEFASHLNLKQGVVTTNGTAALHLAVLAAGVKPGDEVIIPSFTFAATAECVLYAGAKPVFVDIDPNTYNVDPECVDKAITPKTKAIIVVHYGGQMADMDPIMESAERQGACVIEDATEAHGATYKNRQAGAVAKIGCFSFYPNKNMTTGEGGMLVTDDAEIAEKARLLRNHGQVSRFHHIMIGYNYKMSDILAALGLAQLKRLNWVIQKKKEAAQFYEKLLSGVKGVQTPYVMPAASHTYMFYTLKFINAGARDLIMQHLEQDGIETVVAFPPLHMQSIYRSLCKFDDEDLRVTEDCANRVLSLPIYPHIARHDQEFIIKSMLEELKT